MYSGFWRRLAAFIIDLFISVVFVWLFNLFIGLIVSLIAHYANINLSILNGDLTYYYKNNLLPGQESKIQYSTSLIFILITSSISFLLTVLSVFLYFVLFESSSKQGTFGKSAMGIIVTNLYGEKISFWSVLAKPCQSFDFCNFRRRILHLRLHSKEAICSRYIIRMSCYEKS